MTAIDTPPPVRPEDRPPALAPSPEARLQHLFRLSRREGLVHPLHALVLKYRRDQAGA